MRNPFEFEDDDRLVGEDTDEPTFSIHDFKKWLDKNGGELTDGDGDEVKPRRRRRPG